MAERAAGEAKPLLSILPGHPLWGAQADAALARVALARGDTATAAEAGRAAFATLDGAMSEDLAWEIQLPAAEALVAGGSEEEGTEVRERLSLLLSLVVPRILDEEVRVQWVKGPIGRELMRIAAPLVERGASTPSGDGDIDLSGDQTKLLRLLAEGRTNREIADEYGVTEESVPEQLADLFVSMGASSRADATAAALMGGLV